MQIPDDLPPVACEYAQIEQVIRNLVENAVIHTGPDARVTIAAKRQDETIRTSIVDTGAGIPPPDRERVLRPFERGATSAPGSGLGLTIARGFVEAHGGRLWIEDRCHGGTRATFTLPIWNRVS